ncbi:MAG TPA: hypothetical protein VFD58_05670 [Blastocatellia bacterium]|nr:hypothetical protein [Blastocatellia bacterium]
MNIRRILLTVAIAALVTVTATVTNAQEHGSAAVSEGQTARSEKRTVESAGKTEFEPILQGGLIGALERAKEAQKKAFSGSWEGVITPEEGGPPPFRILFTFGVDGTVVESDAGPPDPQNASASHGAWELTADREFLVVYKQLIFDASGNLSVLFKGRVKFRLNETEDEISGPVKVELADSLGNVFLTGEGTIKCTKIRVEPLD